MKLSNNSGEYCHSIARIIVHPAGTLDLPDAGYWTEVAEFPRCIAEASTEQGVVEQTIANIKAMSAGGTEGVVIERAL